MTCSTCHGSGFVTVDWGDMTCPRCHGEIDAEERAAEEWKAAGFDDMSPLEQWHADANR